MPTRIMALRPHAEERARLTSLNTSALEAPASRSMGRPRPRASRRFGAGQSACAKPPQREADGEKLLALLLDLVERLGEALERVLVGRGGAATGGALHRHVGALAHGVDHTRLLGHVLDPGA